MIHLRTLDGSNEDMVDPAFRKIQFEDERAIIIVSTNLRHAWTALPPPDADTTDLPAALAAFIKASQARTDDERLLLPQNRDMEVHTGWRDEIYYHWNHVFWDVSQFLGELACTGVHMHPPSHSAFAVDYRAGKGGVEKVWETDILVIPAYLAPGVSVRFSRRVEDVKGEGDDVMGEGDAGEGETVLGTFDGTNVYEIWYVRRNTSVMIHVDATTTTEASGDVAAVMVYGTLCRDVHGAGGDEEAEN